ncbi:MAG: hypothetical protein LBG60_16150, partial [Bifidobacteriaceae bacterium]|nr:hypothetical protein [Bifidobacteriaceae bacterium]
AADVADAADAARGPEGAGGPQTPRPAKAPKGAARLGPPAVFLAAVVTLVAAIMVLLVSLDGCEPEVVEFDSEIYCSAIAQPQVQLDSKAMIDGDEQALNDAKKLYEDLKQLAPDELADEWSLIVKDLESMIKAASGATSAESVDYQAFTDAFKAIELDKRDRCGH